jgi:glutaminase
VERIPDTSTPVARRRYVSTGSLPPPQQTQDIIDTAYLIFRDIEDGENFHSYPALAQMPPELFGVSLATADGRQYAAGDAAVPFTMMSVAKPFLFALVVEAIGAEVVRHSVGLNATGMEFNSVVAIELQDGHLTNPMVNAGAMATLSLAPGGRAPAKWRFVVDGMSRFAGRELKVDEGVFASVSATNWRNQAVARLLYAYDRLYFDPVAVTDLYTKMSSLEVTARDLAVMAGTLANGGVNPVTGDRVVDPLSCQHTLAVMTTAGLYETSGDWLFDIGVPGKSGVAGGMIAVAPGKGGLGAFSPPLDGAGNSVRGQLVTKYLSQELGLNIFASAAQGAAVR